MTMKTNDCDGLQRLFELAGDDLEALEALLISLNRMTANRRRKEKKSHRRC